MTSAARFTDGVDPEVAAGIRQVGEMLISDIDSVAEQLVRKILDNEPAYEAGTTITLDELRSTVRETASGVFEVIAGQPPDSSRFEQNGRRRAASSIPLHAVLHAYRIGGLHHWEWFARVAATLPLGDRIIAEGSNTVWSIIDLASEYVVRGYRDEIAGHRRRSAHERAAMLGRLIEGKVGANVELWDAAEALYLPVTGTFVLVAAPLSEAGTEAVPDAERALASLNLRSAWLTDLTNQVGLIDAGSTNQVPRIRQALESIARGPVGMSEQFRNIGAAPVALRQARVAAAAGSGARPGVTVYSEVPLQAMLVLAPQSAEQVLQAVLGPVLRAPRNDRALLMQTLEAWILTDGSTVDCAKRLYVHRNSVTRRLQKVFERTGWDPQTPRGMAMLYVAVETYRMTRASLDGYAPPFDDAVPNSI